MHERKDLVDLDDLVEMKTRVQGENHHQIPQCDVQRHGSSSSFQMNCSVLYIKRFCKAHAPRLQYANATITFIKSQFLRASYTTRVGVSLNVRPRSGWLATKSTGEWTIASPGAAVV